MDHAVCRVWKKTKATLELVGGKDMCVLYEHVEVLEAADTFEAAMRKIEEGIKYQTIQATARFKLFTKMPQGSLSLQSGILRSGTKRRDAFGMTMMPGTSYFFKLTVLSYSRR